MSSVLAYIRTSSKDLSKAADETATQLHAITRWAGENGHDVVSVYTDNAVSGTTLPATRKGWSALIDRINRDVEYFIVVVTEASRIARNGGYLDMALAEVRSLECDCADIDDGIFEDPKDESPDAWFQRQIMLLLPELERRRIVARLQRGKARAQAEGRPTARYPKVSDFQCLQIIALSRSGRTVQEIMESEGVSRATVYRCLKSDASHRS